MFPFESLTRPRSLTGDLKVNPQVAVVERNTTPYKTERQQVYIFAFIFRACKPLSYTLTCVTK